MGEIVIFVLSFIFIWIGMGFWPFFWAFVTWVALANIAKSIYKTHSNWVNFGAKYGVIILSFFAIQQKWNNPVITAIAIAVAVILIVLG